MSNEDHVMALLEEGNPAPKLGDDASIEFDALTYLATLEQRSREMTRLETKESREDTSQRPKMPWLVAAIVVLVLGAAVVVFNLMDSSMTSSPVAEAPQRIPLEGAEEHPGAAEAFSEVEAAYAMFNAGDPAWIEIRMRGSYFGTPEEEEANKEEEREFWTARMTAGARIDVSGCESRGSGEWPGIADPGVPTATGYYFVCEVTQIDPLLEIGGAGWSETHHWVVDDSGVVAAGASGVTSEDLAFLEAFGEWLTSTHPEESAELVPLLDQPGYGFADSATRTLIIDYAEEFVAQSDVYPLDSPDT